METLVLKCLESAEGNNLRGMNELRIRCISTGTGASPSGVRPKQSDGTYKMIQYRILSGTGHLADGNDVNKGTSYDINNYCRVFVPSGETILQIKNFDVITDVLGYEGNSFTIPLEVTNAPNIVVDLSELKNKLFLKQVYIENANNGYVDGTDIKDLSNLTELTYFNATPYVDNKIGGSLSSLSNLKKLETCFLGIYNKRVIVEFGINDLIAMTAITHMEIQGGTFTGGDVYELLQNKSYVNFLFDRTISKTANVTCSYVSGTSTIPEFTLKMLSINGSYQGARFISNADAKALLTLIKDGINANKITVESGTEVKLGLIQEADAELNTLKTDLSSLGVTVTLRN